MRKTVLKSEKVKDTGTRPYSRAVKKGNMIFVSGTIGINADGVLVKGGIKGQTRQALDNIKALLEAGGASLDDVMYMTSFFANLDRDYGFFNEVRAEYFKQDPPASTAVQATLVNMSKSSYYQMEQPGDEALVEIDAVAVLG